MDVVARCVHGLEWVSAAEIAACLPDAERIRFSRREVAFGVPSASGALLDLRTVDDLFATVGRVPASGTGAAAAQEAAAALLALPWTERIEAITRLRSVPAAPVLDVVASVEGRRGYSRFALEHALGPPLAGLLEGSYLRRTAQGRAPGDPDLTLRVFVRDSGAVATVRLAARPLHRRTYKLDTGPGTLHPPLAAALVHLAAPAPGAALLDPFCGDGTIGIETALAYPDVAVTCQDVDRDRLRNASRNAERAGVTLRLAQADAGCPGVDDGRYDAVVTNPPWNLSVDAAGSVRRSLAPLWRRMPDLLTGSGRLVAVTAAGLEVPDMLRSLGLTLGLAVRVRLAGRVSHVLLAAPAGRPTPVLPEHLVLWRERAIAAGVVTATGF